MKYRCNYKFIHYLQLLAVLPAAVVFLICVLLYPFEKITALLLFSLSIPILIFIEVKYIPMLVKARICVLSRDYVIVESGILFRRCRTIPRVNIQYAALHSGILSKMFGIAEVRLMLGAGNVMLWGLGRSDADKIILRLEQGEQ